LLSAAAAAWRDFSSSWSDLPLEANAAFIEWKGGFSANQVFLAGDSVLVSLLYLRLGGALPPQWAAIPLLVLPEVEWEGDQLPRPCLQRAQ
jgi:hypothetical protein